MSHSKALPVSVENVKLTLLWLIRPEGPLSIVVSGSIRPASLV